MAKHSFIGSTVLGIILFIISSVFFPAATFGFIFQTAAQATGMLLSSGGGDYGGLAGQGEALIPIIFAIIINIVLYYGLATIILFVFSLFSKKKD